MGAYGVGKPRGPGQGALGDVVSAGSDLSVQDGENV